jgi:hypothetical protein
VRPLIHGATYFARLHEELTALQAGDRVWFTDWRGDADERLLADGLSIGDVLAGLARAGVEVRALSGDPTESAYRPRSAADPTSC